VDHFVKYANRYGPDAAQKKFGIYIWQVLPDNPLDIVNVEPCLFNFPELGHQKTNGLAMPVGIATIPVHSGSCHDFRQCQTGFHGPLDIRISVSLADAMILSRNFMC